MQDRQTGEIFMGDGVETSVQTPMPMYQSHKKVWAFKIADIKRGQLADGSATIVPAEPTYLPFRVDRAYMLKHDPQVGGYYVVYEDGYKSFSPAKAFEEGYTRC